MPYDGRWLRTVATLACICPNNQTSLSSVNSRPDANPWRNVAHAAVDMCALSDDDYFDPEKKHKRSRQGRKSGATTCPLFPIQLTATRYHGQRAEQGDGQGG